MIVNVVLKAGIPTFMVTDSMLISQFIERGFGNSA